MTIKQAANAAAAVFIAAAAATMLGGCDSQYYHRDDVKFKPNPNPVERYEITVKVENAPGPFKTALGTADYQIVNNECRPAASAHYRRARFTPY